MTSRSSGTVWRTHKFGQQGGPAGVVVCARPGMTQVRQKEDGLSRSGRTHVSFQYLQVAHSGVNVEEGVDFDDLLPDHVLQMLEHVVVDVEAEALAL